MRIIIMALALGLAGCVLMPVKSDVSSFSNLIEIVNGDTFFISPNEHQRLSAEFHAYALSISNRLAQKGWEQSESKNQSKFIISLDYGVSGNNVKTSSSPVYTGLEQVDYASDSYTTYERFFEMRIIEAGTLKPVYETKAKSEGGSATFGLIAECMFDMALENFPHSSHKKNNMKAMAECGE